ncbi:MAG: Rrf2 family transcriptional regulator [Kiritimatiellae bacterium]|nr:Rrf2 family transcriptional regulator [Kiritimatiellia bacterium]
MSTRGRYAVRMMLYLAARHGAGKGISKEEIARAEGISPGYAEQILTKLKVAGLVVTTRGRQGGYALACEPATITLGSLLQAAEGKLALVPCLTSQRCSRQEHCTMYSVWAEINSSFLRILEGTTLNQLLERARRMTPRGDVVFDI